MRNKGKIIPLTGIESQNSPNSFVPSFNKDEPITYP